jgi:hypothetical protein
MPFGSTSTVTLYIDNISGPTYNPSTDVFSATSIVSNMWMSSNNPNIGNVYIGQPAANGGTSDFNYDGGTDGLFFFSNRASTATGITTFSSTNTTLLSIYNSGTVLVSGTTNATSSTTGVFQVKGGVGIVKDLYVGGNIYSTGQISATGGVDVTPATPTTIGGVYAYTTSTGANTAVGYNAGNVTATGANNIAVGATALFFNTVGSSNVAIGASTLYLNNSSNNIAVGYCALYNSTGYNNVGLGYAAGAAITTGNGNVILGANTGSTIAALSNNIIISDGSGNIRLTANQTGLVNVPSTLGSVSTTTGALTVAGGVGVANNVYVGNRVGWVSSTTNISAVYQVYNPATNSLDTIFG